MRDEYRIPANGMSLDAIQNKLDIAARALGSASHGFDEDDLCCKQLVLLEKYLYEVIEKLDERQDLETLYGKS
jgi:hypothetical protein